MKILLLEDSSADAALTIRALKKKLPDCEIDHATTLKKARDCLSVKQPYDLALLDMELSDGNGIDILIEIRQKQMNMAVAMLTCRGDEEVATAALKAGADDYMVKQPGYISKISQLVEFAIENHHQFQRRESNIIHVLYIEHDAADVDLTIRYLTRYAPYIRIKNVSTGEDALKLLADKETAYGKCECQVVLMDYRLPGMASLEIIKQLREDRKLDIPIIIVTGHGNEEVAVQALKIGASEYLVKRDNYLASLPSLIVGVYEHCELKRKQKALEESEVKYRLLAENSGDVIFTFDFDLNYTYISPAIFALLGYRPEEIINRNVLETLTPASKNLIKQLTEEYIPAIRSGNFSVEPIVLELETCKKDGSTIWAEIKISILTDSKGEALGLLGVSRDVSKRKAAQSELRKLSLAVIQSPESIVITDKNGEIEYVNPRFTHLTGYEKEEVLGENPRILNAGEQPKSYYKELWDTILSGNDWYGEFRNKKKNGDLYWESASISPLVNEEGRITHFVAVKEDITEKKKMIQDLIEAKVKAEAANRLKTAFLNNISHEVRTPLNGILGFGDMIVQPGLSQNEKEAYLRILHKSSNRLVQTITSFMDISLIVSGNMQVSKMRFSLDCLLTDIYEMFLNSFQEKDLDLKLKLEPGDFNMSVETDKEILIKVFSHLLDNALKFTMEGTVQFGYTRKNDAVEFFVEDNGIGIDAEMQETIFEYFMQEDPQIVSGYEGSGLGLSITKGLVELLGGEISLKSVKGKGTAVRFSLLHAEKENGYENQGRSIPPANGNLVLIAEDDYVNRLLSETMLREAGIQFISVENGQEAVEQCLNNPDIDLVLMDLKMPVMDGFEATRQIKAIKSHLPVIAITAQAMQGDREKVLQAGCDDYIPKPFDRTRLVSLVKSYRK